MRTNIYGSDPESSKIPRTKTKPALRARFGVADVLVVGLMAWRDKGIEPKQLSQAASKRASPWAAACLVEFQEVPEDL